MKILLLVIILMRLTVNGMVKIIGTKEEVQVIANMIHDTEYGACTYRTRNMQDDLTPEL